MMPLTTTSAESGVVAQPVGASTSPDASTNGNLFAQLFQTLQPTEVVFSEALSLEALPLERPTLSTDVALPSITQLETLSTTTFVSTPPAGVSLLSIQSALDTQVRANSLSPLDRDVAESSGTSVVSTEAATPALPLSLNPMLLPTSMNLGEPMPVPMSQGSMKPESLTSHTSQQSSTSLSLRDLEVDRMPPSLSLTTQPILVTATNLATTLQPLVQQLTASVLTLSPPNDTLTVNARETLLSLPSETALSVSSAELPKVALTALTASMAIQPATQQSTTGLTNPVLIPGHAVNDLGWSDAFGMRVAVLAQQGTQTATLQMNPADLGPIQVRISLNDQSAKVEFNTLQQTTSDLITAAMPRLAAAFEQQGMRLEDTRVNLMNARPDTFSSASGFAFRQDTSGQSGGSSPSSSWPEQQKSADVLPDRVGPARDSRPMGEKSQVDYYA